MRSEPANKIMDVHCVFFKIDLAGFVKNFRRVAGLVTAAAAYVLGIAGTRILGSRVASFVALSEVVAAVIFAWLLLGEVPATIQMVGGALVLIGVVGVKLGERSVEIGPELELDVP